MPNFFEPVSAPPRLGADSGGVELNHDDERGSGGSTGGEAIAQADVGKGTEVDEVNVVRGCRC